MIIFISQQFQFIIKHIQILYPILKYQFFLIVDIVVNRYNNIM